MKTDDLISMLAQDAAPQPAAPVAQRAALGIVAGLVVAVLGYWLVLGPRAGLEAAMMQPVILAKTLLPLALFALALMLGLRASRPAAAPGTPKRLIWVVPVIGAALVVWAFVTTPASQRVTDWLGHSIPVCLPAITLLSMPILTGLIAALRRGAPLRPHLAGALAGLAAGGLGAALYSTFCTEDSPLFYGTWYTLGILASTGIGAIAGRWLRW
ncbi:NrsF family protein [Pseudooceanicola sp. C21-150M6]|uniref:NrsF family protein n=1 Tax=Pseudooceanicola sp. C21-150M6 TaxID=3434355 RepID=UPI003D7F46F6